jgi:dTDP-4-amino-4,6-dideoxygalactose transaminase
MTMQWRIALADLDYGIEEEQAVLHVLRSRWLTMGPVTQEFEREFAAMHHVKHALGVTNATVALHMACIALGLGPGDEVIAPSLSFVATTNAVLYTGASVKFAEIIGPDELTISPESIASQITPRTKAIIVMHYGGYPCMMSEIMALANQHGLRVIEDAAHAPGAALNGQPLGAWGDIGCFSFFSNKNLSTGEGGMVVTNDDTLAEKLKLLRSHGMTSLTWDRHKGHAYSYDVVELGFNYRIDEIRSALGLTQLRKLVSNNARREFITQTYWHSLLDTGVGLPFRHFRTGWKPAYHIFPILLPESVDRLKFIDAMRYAGIQTSIHYPPIHLFTQYQRLYPGSKYPITEAVAAREVTLPLYSSMTDEQVLEVVQAVKTAL